jgi:hypothetical protein
MHSIYEPVGLEEPLLILRDTERSQFIYVRTTIWSRFESICGADKPLEDMVGARRRIVLGDIKIDLFQVALGILS